MSKKRVQKFMKETRVDLSMSGATHVTIHHYSNYDTEYKKLKTAYKFSI